MEQGEIKRGLVIGKFMPIHNGHIALINFALTACDEVIVSMSYTELDQIDPQLRFNWLKEIFKYEPRVKPAIIIDNFDQEDLPLEKRTNIWADKMREVYPPIDILISSEKYGSYFARNLKAIHRSFDPERKTIPVSATLIRNQPFKYWDFIPDLVKPFFVKKICFYGPESTGKSTMALKMAQLYQTVSVPEVARELIINNDLSADDFIKIAIAQNQRVIAQTKIANKILFCDTDIITTQIYAQHYLGVYLPELDEYERAISYDQYFLMNTDVAWVADGLRDLGDRRAEMFKIFKQCLIDRNIDFIEVVGNYQQREHIIKDYIDNLLSN